MEELADIIVAKLMSKQKEFDKQFIEEIEMSNVPIEIREKLSPKDKILMDIASLVIKMDNFTDKEEYEKAESCQKKIKQLRDELENF